MMVFALFSVAMVALQLVVVWQMWPARPSPDAIERHRVRMLMRAMRKNDFLTSGSQFPDRSWREEESI